MKLLLYFILFFLIIYSCSNEHQNKNSSDMKKIEIDKDSVIIDLLEKNIKAKLPEPLQLSKLETIHGLRFTSGGVSTKDKVQYCDSSENGFYGRYHLLDFNSKIEQAGIIDIFSPGKMYEWKPSDTNQTIWKIQLKSDIISVWDSIHVGLSREKIILFSQENNGSCTEKDEFFYSCDFNSFSVTYRFENDTLKEFTVIRNCGKKNNNQP